VKPSTKPTFRHRSTHSRVSAAWIPHTDPRRDLLHSPRASRPSPCAPRAWHVCVRQTHPSDAWSPALMVTSPTTQYRGISDRAARGAIRCWRAA
jgi:hypothetical protein